jgi:hypothetical protein
LKDIKIMRKETLTTKDSLWANNSPDDRRREENVGVGTRVVGGLIWIANVVDASQGPV